MGRDRNEIAAAYRTRALAVFEAALEETPVERLGYLHEAMQKMPESVLRGGWGSAPPESPSGQDAERRSHSRLARTSGCPLTLLALGRAPTHRGELVTAERTAREKLANRGLRAEDFYSVWDARLIGWRELLRQIDQHIIERTIGKPPEKSAPRTATADPWTSPGSVDT